MNPTFFCPRRSVGALLLLLIGGSAMAIEEPSFKSLLREEAFEVRAYGPRVVAETVVSGSLSEASNAGFRRVAGYIFGGNRLNDGASAAIAMTAPVTVSRSTKIDMTAPVTTRAEGAGYRLQFVMPARYTLATLPAPLDPNVHLRELPASTYAVVRFSGWCGETKVADRTEALRHWIARRHLTPVGEPELARYDPPWQLPFLRRNEILIPVTTP
jgi:hypothetical protein